MPLPISVQSSFASCGLVILALACAVGGDRRRHQPDASELRPIVAVVPTALGAAPEGPRSSVVSAAPSNAGTTRQVEVADAQPRPLPDACNGASEASLIPPTQCDGPRGNTTTEIPANGLYATSWFGCYFEEDGTIHEDRYDNCEFACGSRGLCTPEQDGPHCEATLRWFAADADRYGCGGRIRVTNCENGNAVVLVTLDRGPHCRTVEQSCRAPVLDMSHDAMVHLFDGRTYGGCDHRRVVVEPVDPGTPLGPR
ncbi:MAG: septal ring lytic transglycosylase RlpA family protein [Deltaproteobacteria bacterium]|nr:septal ring lytic transglycosylase RlpA family protein [Deltaproteobacteria bacterium]